MGFSGSRNNAGARHRRDRCERPSFRNKQELALPLEAFLEGALRAGGVDEMADDCGQQGKKFGDHFARHPKTAGRTFTGGPVFFLKKSQSSLAPVFFFEVSLVPCEESYFIEQAIRFDGEGVVVILAVVSIIEALGISDMLVESGVALLHFAVRFGLDWRRGKKERASEQANQPDHAEPSAREQEFDCHNITWRNCSARS